jgi:HEAT repeat protein
MGLDKELADIAISALKEIPGRDSAEAIANGLSSSFTNIRSMAAFTLGEIALSGRREDAQATLDRLATALRNPGEGLRVLDEIVHSLGKIGGDQAFDSLVEILKTSGTPAELKAKALHGPGRFWGAADYSRFVSLATDIIKGWPIETCEGIRHSNIINHITNPLRVLILARLKIT